MFKNPLISFARIPPPGLKPQRGMQLTGYPLSLIKYGTKWRSTAKLKARSEASRQFFISRNFDLKLRFALLVSLCSAIFVPIKV
jgi:hypothetical protein